MELRIGIREGLLHPTTHRMMKMVVSYVSTVYDIRPGLMDLEGAIFDGVDSLLCNKIVNDVRRKFRRQLRYIDVECL